MSTNNQLSSTSSQPLYPKKSEKIVGNKRKYRRYNWIFLLSVFFPVVTVGVFNIFVDPYDVFNTPNFLGINHLKPRKDNTDRLNKAIDIIRIKPVTVLIGSSITKQGLDPNHPAFNNEQPVYNLGLNSANIYELRPYIEHVFANQKELDLIILGLDFFMFDTLLKNRANFSENRLEKRHISSTDLLNISLSLNAFLPSTETVAYSKKIPPDSIGYGENGFTPYRNPDPEKTWELFRRNLGAYYKMYTKYKFSDNFCFAIYN
ncbi:hypothetical protein [Hydrocoleum sp. CS-953]|uniref:hypothetical protein n=1 Tax=Hydrocoleum sp. CS-953 TaxID=1671698 RepID=UPI000B9A38B8|nr:hypothetical protein [Hydrocoleum sp. CS-953]